MASERGEDVKNYKSTNTEDLQEHSNGNDTDSCHTVDDVASLIQQK